MLQWADKLLTDAMNGRAVQVLTSSCHGWAGTNSYNLRICHRSASFSIANTSAIQDPTVFSLCQSFSLMCLFFFPQCLHPAWSSLLGGPAKAFVLYKVVPKCGPQTSSTGTTMQILQTSKIRGARDLYFNKLSRRCSGMLTFENYCCQRKTLESNPSPGFIFQLLKNTY